MGGKDDYASSGGSNVFRCPSNISILLGLQWDFVGENPVDLDCSCVAFDAEGMVVETIFFNNLTSAGGYMLHTGDNQTGEDEGEDDESLIFHMSKIPPEVKHLMVCVSSYTGADFTYVEKARVRVVNLATKESVGGFQLGVVGRHTATLLCVFARVPNELGEEDTSNAGWWDLREINIPCYGFTFCDVIPKMLDLLGVPKEDHDAHLANLPDFSLEKKDPMWDLILSNVKFGLGWDGENDLDASMVMLDANGRYVDHLHAKYGRLRCGGGAADKELLLAAAAAESASGLPGIGPPASRSPQPHGNNNGDHHSGGAPFNYPGESPGGGGGGGHNYPAGSPESAIHQLLRVPVAEHSGDKLNGFDADGDDEFITVDLMRVDPRVHVIYFMVILYDGVAKHLSEVPKCYARFLNKKNAGSSKSSGSFKEVDRLPISQLLDDESHTVLVPYAVYRRSFATWTLVSVSELMSGRDWVDVFPFLRAFTALDVSCDKWADWKRDIAPFAVRITIRKIRDLGPLEPHHFACRCMAWVHDRHGVGRFKTKKQRKRDNIEFNESCTFFVDKLDVIRVLVFESAVVGHVDIPMAEFFPLTPPALTLQSMCFGPAASNFNVVNLKEQQGNPNALNPVRPDQQPPPLSSSFQGAGAAAAAAASMPGSPAAGVVSPQADRQLKNNSNLAASGRISPQQNNNNNNNNNGFGELDSHLHHGASPAASMLSPLAAAHREGSIKGGSFMGGRARPVMDGEIMLDQWLPLQGIGVQGEIQLLLERVPLVEAIQEEGRSRSLTHAAKQEESSSSSCSLA